MQLVNNLPRNRYIHIYLQKRQNVTEINNEGAEGGLEVDDLVVEAEGDDEVVVEDEAAVENDLEIEEEVAVEEEMDVEEEICVDDDLEDEVEREDDEEDEGENREEFEDSDTEFRVDEEE
ncbi:hypothetical protein V6N13_058780 [Hibiscus sabdariffa]|uniref:Uncharacterized protein n=1 Tax=Hibiscus sabdariffa TaxID=183260 RepID=A0ABR2GF51_9ROSI